MAAKSTISNAAFQTNPRGVEALSNHVVPNTIQSFRRTLVGLKPTLLVDVVLLDGFRRTLVGLKPLFWINGRYDLVVSDEPSWG